MGDFGGGDDFGGDFGEGMDDFGGGEPDFGGGDDFTDDELDQMESDLGDAADAL